MNDLTKSLAELGEMIDRNVSRIAMLEAERDAANIKADGLLEMSERLEATLARKQRAIDAAMSARRSGMNAACIADILRPEATPTDVQPLPHGVSPVGKPQPLQDVEQLPPIGQHHPDDPLQTEWTDDGFRITKQPEEWRGRFEEPHAEVMIRSESSPDWESPDDLWLCGSYEFSDADLVVVPASDRARVWAAICSLNAKYRKTQPAQPEPGGDANRDAPPRSDDRAVRLVKILASLVRKHCTPVDADLLILDKIVAECDGGGR